MIVGSLLEWLNLNGKFKCFEYSYRNFKLDISIDSENKSVST